MKLTLQVDPRAALLVAAGMTLLLARACAHFSNGEDAPSSTPKLPYAEPARPTDAPTPAPNFGDFRVWRTEETKKSPAVVNTEFATSDDRLLCEARWIRRCEESIDGAKEFGCKDVLPHRTCKGERYPLLTCANKTAERNGTHFVHCSRDATPEERDMVEVRGCKRQVRSKHIVFAGSPLVAITDTKELLRVFPIRSESDGEWYVREFINLERPPYGYVADPALDFFQEPIERKADAATKPTRLSFGIWAEHTPHCGCNHDSLNLHLRVFPDGLIRLEGQKVVKSNPNDVCVD